MQSPFQFVRMTFYGFFGFKSIICASWYFPHIVCIYLHRSVSVYRLHPFPSVFVPSFLPLLQLFASTASAEYPCPIVFGCVHHGSHRYSECYLCACLVSSTVIGHVIPCYLLHVARISSLFVVHMDFYSFSLSRLFPFHGKYFLHMYMKI